MGLCTSSWEREFDTWGFFSIGFYQGPNKALALSQFKLGHYDISKGFAGALILKIQLKVVRAVITTYQTASNDIEELFE